MPYLLAILTGIVYAFQKINDKNIISKFHLDYMYMGVYRNLIPLIILSFPFVFMNHIHYLFNPVFILYIFIMSILNISKTLLYYMSLKRFDVSYISIIETSTPLFMTMIAFIFLQEKLGVSSIIGLILVIIGNVFLEISRLKHIGHFDIKKSGWPFIVIIMILSGFIGVVSKKAILIGSVEAFLWSIYFIMFLFFIFLYRRKYSRKNREKHGITKIPHKYIFPVSFTGVLLTVAATLQMYSYKSLPIGKVSGIGTIEVITILALEYLFIQKQVNPVRLWSALLVLLGIFLIIV